MVYRWVVTPTITSVLSTIVPSIYTTLARQTDPQPRWSGSGHPRWSNKCIRLIMIPVTPSIIVTSILALVIVPLVSVLALTMLQVSNTTPSIMIANN